MFSYAWMHMTWKEVKINMQQKGIYKQLHKESACQTTGRLIEEQLQLQCVPRPCACQVRIYFSNSVRNLKSKMMLVWTPAIYVTQCLLQGAV